MTPDQIIEQEKSRQAVPGGATPITPDSIIASEKARLANSASGSFYTMRETQPDRASKVISLADRMGADRGFVDRNLETMEETAAEQEREGLLSQFPRVSQFFSDPYRAAEAKDSVPNFAEIERVYSERRKKKKGWMEAPFSQAGDLGRSAAGDLVGMFGQGVRGAGDLVGAYVGTMRSGADMVPGLREGLAGLDEFEAEYAPDAKILAPQNYLRKAGGGVADLGDVIRPEDMGFEDKVAGAVGQIVGAVLTTIVGGPAASTGLFMGMGADQQGQAMRQAGLNPDEMLPELVAGAGVTGLSEQLRLGSILRVMPREARERVASKVISRILGQAGEEAIQEGTEGVLQNLITTTYDADASLFEGVSEQMTTAGAAAAVFQAFVEAALPGRSRGVRAETNAQELTDIREIIEQTPVFQRSRESIEAFLQQAGEGETVLLHGEDLIELYQSDPEVFAQRMDEVGLTEEDIQRAMDGHDVEADAAKVLSVSEGFEDWVKTVKADEDTPSLREMEREIEESDAVGAVDFTEAFERIAEQDEALEGFERVQRAVTEQLLGAGRGQAESEAAGAVWGAMFRQLAEAGVDEGAVFERLGLQVNPKPAQRLPKPQEPQSLHSYIRGLGGIRESFGEDGRGHMRGEIDARLGERMPGLINNQSGVTLDELFRAVTEEGGYDIRDEQELLDLLDQDLSGERVYPVGEGEVFAAELDAYEAQFEAPDGEVMDQAAEAGYEGQDTGEAREWLSATESGLDMSQEARMSRAESMGFDTNTVWYHGTNADIEQFSRFKAKGNDREIGIHVGTMDQANFMAKAKSGGMRRNTYVGAPNVVPLHVRARNSLRLSDLGNWSPENMAAVLRQEHGIEIAPTGASGEVIGVDVRKAIKEAGYDSIVYKNAYEGNRDADSLILLDTEQLRSVNAAFDPNAVSSSMLLAQSAGYTGQDAGEATEWLQASRKGLDMSQDARMSRAREMGFDTDTVLYHGTGRDIDAFALPETTGERGGGARGRGDGGIWFTSKPEIAEDYANVAAKRQSRRDRSLAYHEEMADISRRRAAGELTVEEMAIEQTNVEVKYGGLPLLDESGSNVISAYVRLKNPLVIPANRFRPVNAEEGMWGGADPLVRGLPKLNGKKHERWSSFRDEAKAMGYDGIVLKNMNDAPTLKRAKSDNVIVFDPSNIRSVNAAFDPDHAGSANLLHQGALKKKHSDGARIKVKKSGNQFKIQSEKGEINAYQKGDAFQISSTFVEEAHRGKGHGVELYERLAQEAFKRGYPLLSDRAVTPEAANAWRALARRGYEVWADYVDPVNDAYGYAKTGNSPFVTVPPKSGMTYAEAIAASLPHQRDTILKNEAIKTTPQKLAKGNVLFQGGEAPRASVLIPGEGVLSEQDVLVRLTKAADRTSFLHESAHIFLELYAALESENEVIAERMGAIRKWLKIKPGEKITSDQHEKFAESFEAYLMEGVAPSAELRGVFHSFRQWFVDVYRWLRGQLRNLEPEARDIFDRMLASDVEIEMAQGQYVGTLSKAMEGLMTPKQVEKYQKHALKAGNVARDKLFKKHMDEVKRRERKAYKEERDRVEDMARQQLMTWPEYKALAEFGEGGRSLDVAESPENTKLNTSERGEHPEIVAPEMGFLSADEMFKKVEKAAPFDRVLKGAVDKIMGDRFGDMMRDGTIESEAMEAVFNEPTIRMMEAERNALAAKASGQPIPLIAIRKEADRLINTMPIDQVIKPGRYAIKARDLHKKALRSAAKSKWDDALRYTHQAMLQHELARRAFKARDEIEKANRYLVKFAAHRKLDPKKIAPAYIAKIREFMALPGAQDQAATRDSLTSFADAEANEGRSVVLPSELLAGRDLPIRRRMTMEQFREFRDTVKNLNTLGRQQSEEARAAFKVKTEEIAAEIDAGWTGTRKPEKRNPTWAERRAANVRTFDAEIIRWPFLIEALQGGKSGKVVEVLETRLRQALTNRNARRQKMTEQLAGILKKHKITQKELNKRVAAPVIENGNVKFEQIIAVALNMGTEQNRDRLVSDPSLNGDMVAIETMLAERLEKRHWDAVQDIWNMIGTLWPEASAVERNATGVTPKKVEAASVQTRFGGYAGGYYPLKYDRKFLRNNDLSQADAVEEWKNGVNGMATRATTRQGFLKERQQNVERPLDLSLNVVLSHIDDVTNDIYMREPASEASRILRSSVVKRTISETHGPEYLKSLETILKRTVTGTERTDTMFEWALQTFRVNASVSILGWNFVTAGLAPVSYFQTIIPRYGLRNVVSGIAEYYGKGPLHTVRVNKKILEKSAFMRERQDTLNREAHELVRKSAVQSKWSKVQGTSYLLMTYLEKYSVSGPLWIGIYNKAITEGKTEADAITEADRAVATTQGSGLEIDQSVLQGGNEGVRLLTFLWGYMSGYYGIVRNDVAKAQGLRKVFPLVKHFIILNLAASSVEALIRQGIGNEDDPYIFSVLQMMRRNILGLLPGSSGFFSKYDSGPAALQVGSSVTRATEAWIKTGEQLYEDGEWEGETVRRATLETAKAAGLFVGFPGLVQAQKIEKTLTEDDDPTLFEAIISGPDDDN